MANTQFDARNITIYPIDIGENNSLMMAELKTRATKFQGISPVNEIVTVEKKAESRANDREVNVECSTSVKILFVNLFARLPTRVSRLNRPRRSDFRSRYAFHYTRLINHLFARDIPSSTFRASVDAFLCPRVRLILGESRLSRDLVRNVCDSLGNPQKRIVRWEIQIAATLRCGADCDICNYFEGIFKKDLAKMNELAKWSGNVMCDCLKFARM